MATSAAEPLAETLARGQRRLSLRVGLRRAGWLSLGAVLVAEVGLALGAPWLFALAGGLLLAALIGLASPPAPDLALTAAVLDARLREDGGGAVVAAGAEALAGQHPRFAEPLVRDAEAALAPHALGALLPLRLPTGLILGGAAALLLPLLLPQARAQPRDLATLPEPPSLLAPDVLGGGAGPPPTEARPEPAEPARRFQVTQADAQAAPRDPLAHLPLDVRQALEQRLKELAAQLPDAGGGAVRQPAETPNADDSADALAQALRDADAERALAELDRLAEQAKQGNAAAAARLAELAQRAGAAGAGAAEADPQPVPDAGADPERPARAGDRTPLPPALQDAVERYFSK